LIINNINYTKLNLF